MDKLESGIVALETEYGPVYVQPSGWERLYLLWTFRHFNSLPLKTLNSRQRKLVERLPRCGTRGLRSGLGRMQVIGTVEGANVPSISAIVPSETDTPAEPIEKLSVPAEVFVSSSSSDLLEEAQSFDEGSQIQQSFVLRRRGNPKIAFTLAIAALLAVFAVSAWHRLQSLRTLSTATVAVQTPVTETSSTLAASLSQTSNPPIELPSTSISPPVLSQAMPADIAAPSKSATVFSAPRLSIEKPAAIISPLEPQAIHSTAKQTPSEMSAIKIRKKENSVVASIQEGKVQEEMPRIQFSGPPRKLIYPDYPDTKAKGKVSLKAVIGGDGRVREVKILSGNKVLSAAAARAIRQWRYDPFLKDGQPAEAETNVSVLFVSADVISLSFSSAFPISR